MKAFFKSFCVAMVTLGMVGCSGETGPKLVKVEGKVISKGAAVAGANVTFVSEKGLMSIGVTSADGTYTLNTQGRPGAPIGKALVGISKSAATPGATTGMTPEDMMKMGKAAAENPNANEPIPSEVSAKFGDPKSSGLTATVDADASKNKLDFNLAE